MTVRAPWMREDVGRPREWRARVVVDEVVDDDDADGDRALDWTRMRMRAFAGTRQRATHDDDVRRRRRRTTTTVYSSGARVRGWITTHASRAYAYARRRRRWSEGGGFARALESDYTSLAVSAARDAVRVGVRRSCGCSTYGRTGALRRSRRGWCVRREGHGARTVDGARARDRGGVQVA